MSFDPKKAAKAQEEYCDKHEIPHFAPNDGICYYCKRNIYLPTNGENGSVRGISVECAGSTLVTGCPHCHYSYVE